MLEQFNVKVNYTLFLIASSFLHAKQNSFLLPKGFVGVVLQCEHWQCGLIGSHSNWAHPNVNVNCELQSTVPAVDSPLQTQASTPQSPMYDCR